MKKLNLEILKKRTQQLKAKSFKIITMNKIIHRNIINKVKTLSDSNKTAIKVFIKVLTNDSLMASSSIELK